MKRNHEPGEIWKDRFISRLPWRYKMMRGLILSFRRKRDALDIKRQDEILECKGLQSAVLARS